MFKCFYYKKCRQADACEDKADQIFNCSYMLMIN